MKVGIIGGGIAGLSAAFWLSRVEGVSVTLFEKDDRLGGCIGTASENGFTIEAGPNGFLDSKPHTVQLFEDAGLGGNLLRSNDAARKRFIMRYGRLIRVPESAPAFFKTDLISFKGKIRLMGELLVPQKKDDHDETVQEFAIRRLGQEAADYMIAPMVSGVFAGDAAKLSLKSAFPVICELESKYGGLFKGMLKKPKKKSGPAGPGGVLTSYIGGLMQGVNDLEEKCAGVEIIKDCTVNEVHKGENGFRLVTSKGEYYFDNVVSAAPAYEAAKFFSTLDKELAEIMAGIPYSPAFVAGLGFNEADVKDELDGFGYLIPKLENKKILGALFTSSIFPSRRPKDKKLVRVIMGGDTDLGRSLMAKTDEELVDIAYDQIKDTLGITAKPVHHKHFRWDKAIPQYYPGHAEKVKAVESICGRIGGVYVGGNVLHGIALNDCTRRSLEITESIARSLEKQD
ncbi:MAG: protoporphyrinogen oxidase [Deferribacterales bacterium]